MNKMEDIWTSGKKYPVIYADPPWTFEAWSKKGLKKSAQQHYDCMTFEELKNLPISNIASDNALMFLWCTKPLFPKQIQLMEIWGFQYKTIGFNWIKMNKKQWTPFYGLGRYTRANMEMCVIGTKGKGLGLPKNRSISELVFSPIREHSRKPDIVREYIMKMYNGPYLELFARTQYPGWTCWGNQVDKFDFADLFDCFSEKMSVS